MEMVFKLVSVQGTQADRSTSSSVSCDLSSVVAAHFRVFSTVEHSLPSRFRRLWFCLLFVIYFKNIFHIHIGNAVTSNRSVIYQGLTILCFQVVSNVLF